MKFLIKSEVIAVLLCEDELICSSIFHVEKVNKR